MVKPTNLIMNKDFYNYPQTYKFTQHILDKSGKITERVTSGLENVLAAYTDYAKEYARITDNNPKNFKIESAYLVGSGARENRYDSDLDLMLIAPQIDEVSEAAVNVYLSLLFFNNRPKDKAIDVFVRKKDKYPERESINLTNQVKKLLNQYNKKLLNNTYQK